MSILLLLGLATYKSAIFSEQFAAQRTLHEQNQALVHGLLEYGVQVVANDYQKVLEIPHPWMLEMAIPDRKANIQISKVTQGVLLTATIIRAQAGSDTFSCIVSKEADEKIHVRGFQKG